MQATINTTEVEEDTIQLGDFVKHRHNQFMCGIVAGAGVVKAGRGGLPVYKVRMANGEHEYIPKDDTVFIAR